MKIKRFHSLALLLFMGLALLLGRLMQIQLFQTENFTKHHINLLKDSVTQRTQEVVLDDGRGQFLDRNGRPLNYVSRHVLVLFPFVKSFQWKRETVADILGLEESRLQTEIERAEKPVIFGGDNPYTLTEDQANRINELAIPGVMAVEKKYPADPVPAEQFIGIVRQSDEILKRYPKKAGRSQLKIGISGLQKNFDEFILPETESKLIYHVDGKGGPLFGIDVKYTGEVNPYLPLQVRTTIDRDIQEEVEKLVDKHGIKNGGAVLLDIATSDIVAIASRPVINQSDPYADNGAKNAMLEEQIPGSVFKTAVAAAAIETGLADGRQVYDCSLTIHDKPAPRKLGSLTFEQSFAQSCNRTFGELARKLKEKDEDMLENYSEKLSLTGTQSWTGNVFHYEKFKQFSVKPGRIFNEAEKKLDNNYVAQTGIGQHEVRITPLAAANMMATIARGGERKLVRGVSAIEYQNGTTLYSFQEQSPDGGTISAYTAQRLQRLLRSVVTETAGTGHALDHLPFEVAGKSGTAETGIGMGTEQLHNKWFAGYFPFRSPQYALVTVNLGVLEQEGAVIPLFADIVNRLYELDRSQ